MPASARPAVLLSILSLTVAVAVAAAPARGAPSRTATTAAPAETLYAHRDWAAAARAYEARARTEPANPRNWYRLGVCYAWLEDWPHAIAADRRADSLGALPQFARYNLACAYARGGQPDSALATLVRLIAARYRQPDALVAENDFATLRGDARFTAAVDGAKRNQTPCEFAPQSRQLDFWIGDWDVTDNINGHGRAGSSHIEKILGGCVIFENWTGALGGTGKSFNAWNPECGCWQQNWMDDSGTVTNYTDGRLAGGAMVYHGRRTAKDGKVSELRLSFFDLGPGHVRQFAETSADGGATWQVGYDLDYRRRP